jgi:hypothetical protein
MATERDTRSWWMLRGYDDKQSFLFSVQVVIEEDDHGLFGATVAGMEEHMAAMGHSADEAADNARALFMATVDDAIDQKTSIAYAIGFNPVTLNVTLKDAPNVFAALATAALAKEKDDDEWLRIPGAVLSDQEHAGH